jgi:hypothetical protein
MKTKYRVIKVDLDGHGVKYAAQFSSEKNVKIKKTKFFIPFITYEKVDVWKVMFEVKKGTDELVPCYYDTLEEAWDRIDMRKYNMELDSKKYKILEIYYE